MSKNSHWLITIEQVLEDYKTDDPVVWNPLAYEALRVLCDENDELYERLKEHQRSAGVE